MRDFLWNTLWDSEERDKTHVTNFNRRTRFVYARAIGTYRQQTKKDILEIREDAYWENGYLDKNMNALHFKEGINSQSLSDFWAIFDKIAKKEWAVYRKENRL